MFSWRGFYAVYTLFLYVFIDYIRWDMHAIFLISCCVSYLGLCVFGVFVSSCVFCVHVCEHCVLCVYTFRPLSIPRRSPSDVSPNKLQNVKSRLNFHSIFQLASHQRGLSAQPSPNLLSTSIGFLIQAEHWISHTSWTLDFSYKLNIGFFMQTKYYLGN